MKLSYFQLGYASMKHKLYDGMPYCVHIEEVRSVLKEFGFYEEYFHDLHVAAIFHDSKEDDGLNDDRLRNEFGLLDCQIDLVSRVTDEPGENRKERKAKTYPKIAASEMATILKLADRIANARKSKEKRLDLFRMYRKEHVEFTAALYNSNYALTHKMFAELDRLLS